MDLLWVTICSLLIFFMQCGFLCLESGLTRSKNSINVAIKNLSDFGVSVIGFWAVGYGLMMGSSFYGLFGTDAFFPNPDGHAAVHLLFQMMFCSTVTTLLSGAVAERMKYLSYVGISLFISAVLYPVFAHWRGAGEVGSGWLHDLGFIDFAGGTYVHGVGGWIALAALLVIGPRVGRFTSQESSEFDSNFLGHNPPLAVLGTGLIFFGWFGFNGGSSLTFDGESIENVVKTILGGSSGMVTAILFSSFLERKPNVLDVIKGTLAGLVAITAGCHLLGRGDALFVGSVGSLMALAFERLLWRHRIDDAVGVISVHALAGAWGTVALALLGDSQAFPSGRLYQLGIQFVGVISCFLWSFGISYILFRILNRFYPMRVTPEEEEIGLNISEHDAETESYRLIEILRRQKLTADLSLRAPENRFTESGLIGHHFNRVMERLQVLFKTNVDLTKESERARQESKNKSRFLADMSHEIRNPLHLLLGASDGLADPSTSEEDRQRFAEIHRNAGEMMSQIVNSILDLSKIEAGAFEVEKIEFNLKDSLKCISLIQAACEKKGVRFVLQISEEIPSCLMGDSFKINQVVMNLLQNALKFTPSGGTIQLLVCADPLQRDRNFVVFEIRDSGKGIADDKLTQIFSPFVQESSHVAREYGGSGLGLNICQRIVNLLGGTIWVESQVDVGTSFFFTLPLHRICSKERSCAGCPKEFVTRVIPLLDETDRLNEDQKILPCRILIAEDSLDSQELLRHFLKDSPVDVMFVDNGEMAVEKFRAQSFDLVFLDAQMPIMDGYRAAEEIRKIEAGRSLLPTPIICLSGATTDLDIKRVLQSGCTSHLPKPIRKEVFLSTIAKYSQMEGRSAQNARKVGG